MTKIQKKAALRTVCLVAVAVPVGTAMALSPAIAAVVVILVGIVVIVGMAYCSFLDYLQEQEQFDD